MKIFIGQINPTVGALSANAERLNAAVERLQESLARFAALRAAANDARGSLLAARRAVPRK